MPPKRSVLCRPPRPLPHSMRLSRQYTNTNTDRARSRRHTNTDRARRTDTERARSRQYTTLTEPLALLRLCSVFASTPRHCLASPVSKVAMG
ncbi:hypothetical protein NDU88_001585 [Pleurodeles waltl]|uniref:Uncharacterized protein n=1 Tax=Pleurodeles waltl TaxID=8319 RepID=A0AAV7W0E4_PLEWA|nr:hypothetical protein NDU88_000424 [Pleurodeles waltl]KAJ1206176.1 hypothetical protein NDU88_001585 [Pleurodeles waltl]